MINEGDQFMKKRGVKKSKGSLDTPTEPAILRPGTCRDNVRVPQVNE